MDVKMDFIHGDLTEKFYMKKPTSLEKDYSLIRTEENLVSFETNSKIYYFFYQISIENLLNLAYLSHPNPI